MGDSALISFRGRCRSPLRGGIVTAVIGVVGPTLLALLLVDIVSAYALVLMYLPGLILVASAWGVRVGLAMAVMASVAIGLFLAPPASSVRPASIDSLVVMAILVIAVLLCGVRRAGDGELWRVLD